jgi:hypothetical protein
VLKIEQKDGTSLVKLVLSRRKSGLQTERLSVPVILGEYGARIHSELAIYIRRLMFGRGESESCTQQNAGKKGILGIYAIERRNGRSEPVYIY